MASLFEPPWPHGVGRGAHRIIMAFMTTCAADADGFVTPQTLAYYAARARGGVGLVTVKMAAPKCCGRQRRRELGIYDDRFLPGLARLVSPRRRMGWQLANRARFGLDLTRRVKAAVVSLLSFTG
jgi:2,4-dienoyl-CoA reductase-like NADH-dependent reductase (Old Yellow Enzyme family)